MPYVLRFILFLYLIIDYSDRLDSDLHSSNNLINDLDTVYENEVKDKKNCEVMASYNGFPRPRSAVARILLEKQQNDINLAAMDKSKWYEVDENKLTPELKQKFLKLSADKETQEFLSKSSDKSTWLWTQLWYLIAKAVLKYFWSVTDINGWLGRGSMFVLSEAHVCSLLKREDRLSYPGSIIDIGAGDGEVSRRFAHLYSKRYATEISGSMRQKLIEKGFEILDTDSWWKESEFDCISMMNLLDRCSKPKTMLQQARASIASDGVLIVALVLPYKPYVEVTQDHRPEERLPISGYNFEEQAATYVEFMKTIGFELEKWSRAPYLCEGDFVQDYYWLDDSIFVFRPIPIQS